MILTQTKLWEIEARLREAQAAADSVLPDQAAHAGEYLTTDGAVVSWGTPAGGAGNVIYVEEGSAAEGDSSAADLTLDFDGTDFNITTAAQTCTITVNDGGVAHSGLSGTHNLTTDIDHDALTNTHSAPVLISGLAADWDAGSYEIRAQTFESDVATGAAPLVVASTTKVANLNADLLDGYSEGAFVRVKGPWVVGNYAVHTDGTNELQQSLVTNTELGYLSGVTGAIQTQLGNKAATTAVVLRDGTQALTADWDAGSFEVRAQTFESDVATGTAPLVIASTTVCTNLNADLLDGNEAAAFAVAAKGVTNGDSHDHSGGDGAQIDHGGLGGLADNDHPQYALATGHVYAVKTADQTKNNDNTYAVDTHLQGLSLAANSQYTFLMQIICQCVTDTPDYKVRIYSSQTDWAMTATSSAVTNAAVVESGAGTNYWTQAGVSITGGSNRSTIWNGFINTATACTIQMQWAQATATAENTILRKGSYILLHKVA